MKKTSFFLIGMAGVLLALGMIALIGCDTGTSNGGDENHGSEQGTGTPQTPDSRTFTSEDGSAKLVLTEILSASVSALASEGAAYSVSDPKSGEVFNYELYHEDAPISKGTVTISASGWNFTDSSGAGSFSASYSDGTLTFSGQINGADIKPVVIGPPPSDSGDNSGGSDKITPIYEENMWGEWIRMDAEETWYISGASIKINGKPSSGSASLKKQSDRVIEVTEGGGKYYLYASRIADASFTGRVAGTGHALSSISSMLMSVTGSDGRKVAVKNLSNGSKKSVQTDGDGVFTVDGIIPGDKYEITPEGGTPVTVTPVADGDDVGTINQGVNFKFGIKAKDSSVDMNELYAQKTYTFNLVIENTGNEDFPAASCQLKFDDGLIYGTLPPSFLGTIEPGKNKPLDITVSCKAIQTESEFKKIGITITDINDKTWEDSVSLKFHKEPVNFNVRSSKDIYGIVITPNGKTYSVLNVTSKTFTFPSSSKDYLVVFSGATTADMETKYSFGLNVMPDTNWDGFNDAKKYEPNDTEADAPQIGIVQGKIMAILHKNDIDYYRVNFSVTAPSTPDEPSNPNEPSNPGEPSAPVNSFTSLASALVYLDAKTGGSTVDDPVQLKLNVNLASSTDGWYALVNALASRNKYVALDLSGCAVNNGAFDSGVNGVKGEGAVKIVSLVLPDSATSIVGTSSAVYASLKTVSGANISTIGDYAFSGCTSLTLTEDSFPKAKSIGAYAFKGCTLLWTASLPEATSIGNYAFDACTALATVSFPKVTGIGSYAFANSGRAPLGITMGTAAPTVGANMFAGINGSRDVTVSVQGGATGYDEAWQSGFKGGNSSINLVIEYQGPNIILNQTAPYAFPAATFGYGAQDANALEVTVSNIGNQSTGNLTIALSNSTAFTLSTTAISSIGVNGSNSFTITPKIGLSAGDHSATVTVSGGTNITAKSFNVSFTVNNPPPTYGISLTANQALHHTFPSVAVNYGAQDANALEVTVTNTGNQPTGNLTIALSNNAAFTLSATSVNSIAAGGNPVSFTVTPKTGLAAGDYSATVTVSGDNRIAAQTFEVSFVVDTVPEYDISVSAVPEFAKKGEGYAAITPLEITVRNIGNRPTGALTAALADEASDAAGISGTGAFVLTDAAIGAIPEGGQAIFRAGPRTGLLAGAGGLTVYTARVVVSGGSGESAVSESINLRFTVAKNCVVSFNVNGGSPAVPAQTLVYGETASEPPANSVSKANLRFRHWYANGQPTVPFDWTAPITADTPLNALWEADVTFNLNGGEGTAPAKQTVKEADKATQPANPARTSYRFDGWYTQTTGGVKWDFAENAVTGHTALYARWTLAWTVTFNLNGGTLDGGIPSQTIANGETATQPDDPTKASHRFDGWYTAVTGGSKWDFASAVTQNLVLYARWVPIQQWTVTLNTNGGYH